MQFKDFCAWCTLVMPVVADAQRIPGRDLFEFPLGSLAEGGALSVSTGDGFRNPAALALGSAMRARFTVSSLTTGADQAVAGQIVGIAYRLPRDVTAGLSLARAAVSGIARTGMDPEPLGEEIPYGTLVVSAQAARPVARHAAAGVALRYAHGELDRERRGGVGIDAGMVAENLLGIDGRAALATFLWRPGQGSDGGAALTAAVDFRVAGRDSLRQVRAGYAYSHAAGLSREHFVSASGRLGPLEGRLGVARTWMSARGETRPRLAIGLHYARYLVSVAREESPSGLSPVYHFTLVATFARE
jgi:hypothetical protein